MSKSKIGRSLPSTIFWPGYGFYSRFGMKLADWEPVSCPEEVGIDQYEIAKLTSRQRR